MEDLLTSEQAAEKHAYGTLNPDYSIKQLLEAFTHYRSCCETAIFADIRRAEVHEARLWQAHTDARRYLHRVLGSFRKQGDEQNAVVRQTSKEFLRFIKDSLTFFRGYIFKLNTAVGGLKELEAIAHHIQQEDTSESSYVIPADCHDVVLGACHRALVYLGDLSRYRAAEKLDKTPRVGPAIGYYDLACNLCPRSGLGHHQLALIALEQRDHLKAIFHLYRAIVVEDPHPNAVKNLHIEFEKTVVAWNCGELIQKGPPNDPAAPKRALVGWFVRLHSLCREGNQVTAYTGLERELFTQLIAQIRQGTLGNTLFRMVMVNIAAQFHASENFQKDPSDKSQAAFLYFFRLNLLFFTILLEMFAESLPTEIPTGVDEEEIYWLATRLPTLARSLLPVLKVYSLWLLANTHLIAGLQSEESIRSAADKFWLAYGRAIDLLAAMFPIWDLDDLPPIAYMLEEDVDTFGVRPLQHSRTHTVWYNQEGDLARPFFSSAGITRASLEGEMLIRVKGLVSDGAVLAEQVDDAPLSMMGTRFLLAGRGYDLPKCLVREYPNPVVTQNALTESSPKVLSYAAAAAASKALRSAPASATAKRQTAAADEASQKSKASRTADRKLHTGFADPANAVSSTNATARNSAGNGITSCAPLQDGGLNPSEDSLAMCSVPSTPKITSPHPWDSMNGRNSSEFPSSLPQGTLQSPVQRPVNGAGKGHSRNTSANSAVNLPLSSSPGQWQNVVGRGRPRNQAKTEAPSVTGDQQAKLHVPQASARNIFATSESMWRSAFAPSDPTPPSAQPD